MLVSLIGLVISLFEALFVRMFYRSKLKVELGLGETMVVLIGFSVAAAAVSTVGGVVLGPLALMLAFALFLLGPPWWLLRKHTPGVAPTAAMTVAAGQMTAPMHGAGDQDGAWANWMGAAFALATRVDIAAADAMATEQWQPLVALRAECADLTARSPLASPAIEVQAQVRDIRDALTMIARAGSVPRDAHGMRSGRAVPCALAH